MVNRIGVLTIGQVPRTDLEQDFQRSLGGFELLQIGALDNMSAEEIKNLSSPDGQILSLRLRNGQETTVSKEKIIPLIQQCISRAENKGVMINVILCTSYFPTFEYKGILLEPGKIMLNIVNSIGLGANLGVLVPTERHREQVTNKWCKIGRKVSIHVVSPFSMQDNVVHPSLRDSLKNHDFLLLDCTSYNSDFKIKLRKHYPGVILAPLEVTLKLCSCLAR